jgi:hypothetical protein
MTHYEDRPEDLVQDTKSFLKSGYGKHIVSTLEEMARGYLSGASNIDAPFPERYAIKYSALKEVLDLVNSPLDDDTPTRG